MIFRNGYENINVELLNWCGEDLAKLCWDFGKHGEFYTHKKEYNESDEDVKKFIQDIMDGKTFPKYLFEGHNISFKVNNISRICLAQLTREKGFFCSESGDVRPLTNDLLIPKSIYKNNDWMEKFKKVMYDLEKLYVELAESGISYMDSRYIMPHCQTISLSYNSNCINFIKSCASRTRNGFADEINYVYKLMRYELLKRIGKLKDRNSQTLWCWLIGKSIIREAYTRDCTYCNDFQEYKTDYVFDEKPHNDIRTSSWRLELEDIYDNKPYLLTDSEKTMIKSWRVNGIMSTYDKEEPYTLYKSIKNMYYYEDKSNGQ